MLEEEMQILLMTFKLVVWEFVLFTQKFIKIKKVWLQYSQWLVDKILHVI
jgi:hypothetical protein